MTTIILSLICANISFTLLLHYKFHKLFESFYNMTDEINEKLDRIDTKLDILLDRNKK